MKTVLKLTFALSLMTGLAACDTTQTVDKIKEVQNYTALACKFLPTVATVAAIFNQQAGSSISGVGGAICDAVTSVPLADGPGDRKPRVGKVIVRGTDLVTGKVIK